MFVISIIRTRSTLQTQKRHLSQLLHGLQQISNKGNLELSNPFFLSSCGNYKIGGLARPSPTFFKFIYNCQAKVILIILFIKRKTGLCYHTKLRILCNDRTYAYIYIGRSKLGLYVLFYMMTLVPFHKYDIKRKE